MVKVVEGLPEDVIHSQQNEQATYARVIAHAPRCQNHVKPVPLTKTEPQEVSFDPYAVSAHIAGQPIQRNLARPHRESKAPSWKSSPGLRSRLPQRHRCGRGRERPPAHSLSTHATTPPRRRARRRATRAAAARPRLPVHNHGRRRAERHRVDVYAIDATPSTRLSG